MTSSARASNEGGTDEIPPSHWPPSASAQPTISSCRGCVMHHSKKATNVRSGSFAPF